MIALQEVYNIPDITCFYDICQPPVLGKKHDLGAFWLLHCWTLCTYPNQVYIRNLQGWGGPAVQYRQSTPMLANLGPVTSDGNLPDKNRTKSGQNFLPVYRSSPPCLDKACLTKVAFSAQKRKVRVVKNADYYVMYWDIKALSPYIHQIWHFGPNCKNTIFCREFP